MRHLLILKGRVVEVAVGENPMQGIETANTLVGGRPPSSSPQTRQKQPIEGCLCTFPEYTTLKNPYEHF